MKKKQDWAYTETTLQQRIEIHDKYSRYEINDWILTKTELTPGEKVLDIGCGNGKQALMYAKAVGASGEVCGMDISQDLLDEATSKSLQEKITIRFINHNADNPLPFPDGKFDVVSCCFSIYYYMDIDKTLSEMKRVLRPGGRIFIAGPTVENAQEMLLLYEKVEGKVIPQTREKRMRDEIIPRIMAVFSGVSVDIFENPIEFPDSDTFLRYFTSTLLFRECQENPERMSAELRKIEQEVDEIIHEKLIFTVTKRVYGISGFKQ